LKIAQIAPVRERVPPKRYGGIELIVHLLTEELVRRGHKVTLFASGDSITKAKLHSWYPAPIREIGGSYLPNLLHASQSFKRADEFDIVHSHMSCTGIAFGALVKKPVLHTLHGVFTDKNKRFYKLNRDAGFYNSISYEQRKFGPEEMNYIGNVYNAIDIKSYPYSDKKKDYFIHISRITEAKGTDIAVDVAKKAGVKLIIAGKIDAGRDTEFFEQKIEPMIDGKQIVFLGEVSEEEKRKLFKEAKGFIFPLRWAEPFGLVLIESLAAGTPVIALASGSVPEVVEHGKTGFIANDVDELVTAVGNVEELSYKDCRKSAEEKFGAKRMVDDYETLYKKIIKIAKT